MKNGRGKLYCIPVDVEGVQSARIEDCELHLFADPHQQQKVGSLVIPPVIMSRYRDLADEEIYGPRRTAVVALTSGELMVVRDGEGHFCLQERNVTVESLVTFTF